MVKRQKNPPAPSPDVATASGVEASTAPDRVALLALKAEIAALRRTVDERLNALSSSVDRLLASSSSVPMPKPEPPREAIPPPPSRAARRQARAPRYRVGDEVYVPRLGGTYVVVEASPQATTFKIQAGAMRAEIGYDEVWSLEDGVPDLPADVVEGDDEPLESESHLSTRLGFNPYIDEIDLHGYSERDAIVTLELFLHHAFMRKVPRVRIIHGKGAGVLRDAVRRELSKTPIVKSIESGPHFRGDDGVTLANLDL